MGGDGKMKKLAAIREQLDIKKIVNDLKNGQMEGDLAAGMEPYPVRPHACQHAPPHFCTQGRKVRNFQRICFPLSSSSSMAVLQKTWRILWSRRGACNRSWRSWRLAAMTGRSTRPRPLQASPRTIRYMVTPSSQPEGSCLWSGSSSRAAKRRSAGRPRRRSCIMHALTINGRGGENAI